MQGDAIQRVAIVGAGLMGHGIAQVFALAGHDVTITDAHKPTLDSALTRIAANLRENASCWRFGTLSRRASSPSSSGTSSAFSVSRMNSRLGSGSS